VDTVSLFGGPAGEHPQRHLAGYAGLMPALITAEQRDGAGSRL